MHYRREFFAPEQKKEAINLALARDLRCAAEVSALETERDHRRSDVVPCLDS